MIEVRPVPGDQDPAYILVGYQGTMCTVRVTTAGGAMIEETRGRFGYARCEEAFDAAIARFPGVYAKIIVDEGHGSVLLQRRANLPGVRSCSARAAA